MGRPAISHGGEPHQRRARRGNEGEGREGNTLARVDLACVEEGGLRAAGGGVGTSRGGSHVD